MFCFSNCLSFPVSVDEFVDVDVVMVDGLVFVLFELACCCCCDEVVDDFVVVMEDDCFCFLVFDWGGFDLANPFVLLPGVMDFDLVVVAVAFVVVEVTLVMVVVGGVVQRLVEEAESVDWVVQVFEITSKALRCTGITFSFEPTTFTVRSSSVCGVGVAI